MSKQTVSVSRFTRLIHPMPAFLVTCAGEDGRPNAIAIAWLTPVSVNPPLLAFAIRPQRYSYELLQENPAFVVNVMAYERAVEVLFCGRCSGRDVNKFATANLTPVPAQAVNAPAIAEALAHVECEVEAEYPAGDHVIVVGRVMAGGGNAGGGPARSYGRPASFPPRWQLLHHQQRRDLRAGRRTGLKGGYVGNPVLGMKIACDVIRECAWHRSLVNRTFKCYNNIAVRIGDDRLRRGRLITDGKPGRSAPVNNGAHTPKCQQHLDPCPAGRDGCRSTGGLIRPEG